MQFLLHRQAVSSRSLYFRKPSGKAKASLICSSLYSKMTLSSVALVVAAAGLSRALVLPNNVGKLPALGWNSWNAYGCNINETDFLQAADRIVSLGFKVCVLS